MDLVQTVRKEGSRGGRAEFKWEDVKNDAQRENYLGHSLMAPVGRWQQGRDLNWYAKGDDESKETEAERIAEEKRKLKEAEEDAMLAAMGLPVPVRAKDNANLEPLGKKAGDNGDKEDKAGDGDEDRARRRDRKERSRRHRDDGDRDRRRRHRSRSRSRDRERRHRHGDRSRSRDRRRDDDREHRRRHRSRSREHRRRDDHRERRRHRDAGENRSRSRSRSRDRRRRHSRSRSPYRKSDRRED